MAQLAPESATFSSLDKQIIGLTDLVEQMKEVLFQTRSATIPPFIYEGIQQMGKAVFQLHNLVNSLEEERRSLRALAQIGQVINSSLDLTEVL